MSDLTYADLMEKFFEHYNAKDYGAATALFLAEAPNFPDHRPLILYNRACAYALNGQPAEALADLHTAIDGDIWYSEKQMREDADFTTLRNLSEFEALTTTSAAKRVTAQNTVKPEHFVFVPSTPQPHPVLLALHSNGNNAAASVNYWKPAVAAGWLLAMLQSSQIGFTTNNFNWDDEAKSIAEVHEHENALHHEYGQALDSSQLVVAGMSAGGRIATLLALTHPHPPRGFIGVGTYLAGKVDELAEHIPAARDRGVRAFLVVGDKDDGSYEDNLKLAELFEKHKLPYRIKVYPGMGHAFPPDFADVLIDALAFITQAVPVNAV